MKKRGAWPGWTVLGCGGVLFVLVLGARLTRSLYFFDPPEKRLLVGPQGPRFRAFIADTGGLGQVEFIVSAADWPYTFLEPFVLADLASDNNAPRVYWSQDGAVLVLCETPPDGSREVAVAAYDFQGHTALRHETARIDALVASHGGLGPAVD